MIERHYATLGFSGCVGCVDVASWFWDNCPVGWQVLYTGKDKRPCNRLEVVCDDLSSDANPKSSESLLLCKHQKAF